MRKVLRYSVAFTLVELLVGIAIITVLGSLSLAAVRSVQSKGKLVAEISAARQLLAAFQRHSAEHNNEVLAGVRSEPASDPDGNPLHYPINERYPWRLAPMLGHDLRGAVLVNEQAALWDKPVENAYAISVYPSFGMNVTFVGGDYSGSSDLVPTPANFSRFGKFCVTRAIDPVAPSRLIVFTSAQSRSSGRGLVEGSHRVKSPSFIRKRWNDRPGEEPDGTGNVAFRHDGKAVAAMFDGHVETLDFNQMQDMRRWSNLAADLDDPDWTLRRP